MKSLKSLLAVAASVFTLTVVSSPVFAERAGVLHSVNLSKNTITIIDDATGKKAEYPLASKAKAVVDGRRKNVKTALVPGQTVVLKFREDSEHKLSAN